MDHAWVVDLVRKAGHLALVQPYLLAVQPADLTAVNDAINNLLIEEEDFEGLKTSIDTYDNSPPRGGVAGRVFRPQTTLAGNSDSSTRKGSRGTNVRPIGAPCARPAGRLPPAHLRRHRQRVRPTHSRGGRLGAGWGPEKRADLHLHRSSLLPVPPPPLQTSRLSDGGALRSARLASSG